MNKLVFINGNKRHFISRFFASLLYAVSVFVFIYFFIETSFLNTEKYTISFLHLIKLEVYLITFALLNSVVKNHHFDLKENKYRTYYSVGTFGYGKWKKIDSLIYTSVYLNKSDVYEIIVWDNSNNRYKISFYDEENAATEMAKEIASKLNIYYYTKDE